LYNELFEQLFEPLEFIEALDGDLSFTEQRQGLQINQGKEI
jgi:hypothetical protein